MYKLEIVSTHSVYKKFRIRVSPAMSLSSPFRGLNTFYEFPNFGIFGQFLEKSPLSFLYFGLEGSSVLLKKLAGKHHIPKTQQRNLAPFEIWIIFFGVLSVCEIYYSTKFFVKLFRGRVRFLVWRTKWNEGLHGMWPDIIWNIYSRQPPIFEICNFCITCFFSSNNTWLNSAFLFIYFRFKNNQKFASILFQWFSLIRYVLFMYYQRVWGVVCSKHFGLH